MIYFAMNSTQLLEALAKLIKCLGNLAKISNDKRRKRSEEKKRYVSKVNSLLQFFLNSSIDQHRESPCIII